MWYSKKTYRTQEMS